jgi:vancomycin resistance protein YoaR
MRERTGIAHSGMKKHVGILVGSAAVAAATFGFFAYKAGHTIRARTLVGTVYVGNMPEDKAERVLAKWWAAQIDRPIVLKSDLLNEPGSITPKELGIGFDIKSTLSQIPRAGVLDCFGKVPATHIAPVLTVDGEALNDLKPQLESHIKSPSKAAVFYEDGKFSRVRETGDARVDLPKLQNRLLLAVLHRSNVHVPFVERGKRVSDQDLASINEVESEFSTHFPTAKKSRCSNIKLASSKLDGIVLMPGDRVSFNSTVGRRTEKSGFQIAGVYKNGKHDFDVGGGICQVSTTLYNAALFANLKIVHRHNHSMPVAYVPLGRDATVDYGVLDLEIENNRDHPIAINSEYHPGKLTFRILGQKDSGMEVKIESDGRQRWDAGTQTVVDPTLAAGKTKVVDKGASGQQINTYRVIYRDGKLVARESLGRSYYKGGQKVIAVGRAPGNPVQGDIRLTSANSH